MIDISAAASDAFARTRYLLWERRSFARWWRYALLSFLSGGNGGFNFRIPGGQSFDLKKKVSLFGLGLATASLGQFDTKFIPAIIIALLALLFLAIFFGWLSSCSQFVLLESVIYDRHELSEPFGRLKGKGTGLFFWTMLVALGFIAPAVFIGGGAAALTSASHNPLLTLPTTLAVFSLLGLLALTLCLLFSLTHHFVLPIAYRQRVGINAAWGLVSGTLGRHKIGALLFVLALVAVSLACLLCIACGVLLLGGISLLAGGVLLGVPGYLLYQAHIPAGAGLCAVAFALLFAGVCLFTLLLVQTPFSIFSRCFGIYVMQQMLPEFGLLPLGGRPEKLPEESVPSDEPRPLGSLLDDSWQRPEF